MPKTDGGEGTAKGKGKARGDVAEAAVCRGRERREEVLQKRGLLGGGGEARSMAQRLAEGRTQAARDNAARPARAAAKESRHDR